MSALAICTQQHQAQSSNLKKLLLEWFRESMCGQVHQKQYDMQYSLFSGAG